MPTRADLADGVYCTTSMNAVCAGYHIVLAKHIKLCNNWYVYIVNIPDGHSTHRWQWGFLPLQILKGGAWSVVHLKIPSILLEDTVYLSMVVKVTLLSQTAMTVSNNRPNCMPSPRTYPSILCYSNESEYYITHTCTQSHTHINMHLHMHARTQACAHIHIHTHHLFPDFSCLSLHGNDLKMMTVIPHQGIGLRWYSTNQPQGGFGQYSVVYIQVHTYRHIVLCLKT